MARTCFIVGIGKAMVVGLMAVQWGCCNTSIHSTDGVIRAGEPGVQLTLSQDMTWKLENNLKKPVYLRMYDSDTIKGSPVPRAFVVPGSTLVYCMGEYRKSEDLRVVVFGEDEAMTTLTLAPGECFRGKLPDGNELTLWEERRASPFELESGEPAPGERPVRVTETTHVLLAAEYYLSDPDKLGEEEKAMSRKTLALDIFDGRRYETWPAEQERRVVVSVPVSRRVRLSTPLWIDYWVAEERPSPTTIPVGQ